VKKVTFRMTGTGEGGADMREIIFFAFSDNRLPILSMHTNKASLEEVFLELTADAESGDMGIETQDEEEVYTDMETENTDTENTEKDGEEEL